MVTDCRDSKTYKTVVIGTQTWMAENLNYAVDSSWCYENSVDSCVKYGRLYTWTGAMNIASSYLSASASAVVSTPHQGVCPVGWHIPTSAEWQTLRGYVDANNGDEGVGISLKSTAGWEYDTDTPTGTDKFGFSGLPAGGRRRDGSFGNAVITACFWSATEYYNAYWVGEWYLYYNDTDLNDNSEGNKGTARSIRCVKD